MIITKTEYIFCFLICQIQDLIRRATAVHGCDFSKTEEMQFFSGRLRFACIWSVAQVGISWKFMQENAKLIAPSGFFRVSAGH
jgi:hypothetical protein